MSKKIEPKRDLKASGRKLWVGVTTKYELRVDELDTLEAACHVTDRIDLMRDELDQSSLMISGSMGQQIVHPLVAEIRAHEAQAAALLGRLKLPDDPSSPGKAAGERSTAARAAVNTRWSNRGA